MLNILRNERTNKNTIFRRTRFVIIRTILMRYLVNNAISLLTLLLQALKREPARKVVESSLDWDMGTMKGQ